MIMVPPPYARLLPVHMPAVGLHDRRGSTVLGAVLAGSNVEVTRKSGRRVGL